MSEAGYDQRMKDDEVLDRVLYRDGLILVFNKPSGIPVHPAGPMRHNLMQYAHLLRFGLKNSPELAHRLDRDTSGCLVLSRNITAARKMQELFSGQKISKSYLALVHGQVTQDHGVIDISLSKRSDIKVGWRMKADVGGSIKALTEYRVLYRNKASSVLQLVPRTGRTHQLRVHCLSLGHPIVGDRIYGFIKEPLLKLHLHAHRIAIPLYKNRGEVVIEARLPSHMHAIEALLPSMAEHAARS